MYLWVYFYFSVFLAVFRNMKKKSNIHPFHHEKFPIEV